MSDQSQSWSIIIFCYNEKETIALVVDKAQEVLKNLAPQKNEIVIVDDGSTDGSADIIKGLSEKHNNIRVIYHSPNKGIGEALLSGYRNAQYENVCAVPADAQFDVEELLPHATIDSNTFISFYRVENTSYSVFRNVLSWVNKKINKLFLGMAMRDVNWVLVYKMAKIKELDLRLNSSLVGSEICSKLLIGGNQLQEIESTYQPRISGESKGASFKVILQAFRDTMKLIMVIREFRREIRS